MSFIVIEGDNGTGKDTLAGKLAPYGFDILSYSVEAKAALKIAREAPSQNSIDKFLEYNKVCSDLCARNCLPSKTGILIRYWTSTLASAYADSGWAESSIDSALDWCLSNMNLPSFFVRLTCKMDERVRRIKVRGASGSDDITIERAERYEHIFTHMMERIPSRWIQISTSEMSPCEIAAKVLLEVQMETNLGNPSIFTQEMSPLYTVA